MKKILLGLGTLASVITPVATVVACGNVSTTRAKKMNDKATEIDFNSNSNQDATSQVEAAKEPETTNTGVLVKSPKAPTQPVNTVLPDIYQFATPKPLKVNGTPEKLKLDKKDGKPSFLGKFIEQKPLESKSWTKAELRIELTHYTNVFKAGVAALSEFINKKIMVNDESLARQKLYEVSHMDHDFDGVTTVEAAKQAINLLKVYGTTLRKVAIQDEVKVAQLHVSRAESYKEILDQAGITAQELASLSIDQNILDEVHAAATQMAENKSVSNIDELIKTLMGAIEAAR